MVTTVSKVIGDTGVFATLQAWNNAAPLSLKTAAKYTCGSFGGTFTQGETVTGQTSAKTAKMLDTDGSTYMVLGDASGSFTNGETLLGRSAASCAITTPASDGGGIIWKGLCQNQIFTSAAVTLDMSGSDADATRHKWLTTDTGCGFKDADGAGAYIPLAFDSTKGATIECTMTVGGGACIVFGEPYPHISGLQISQPNDGSAVALYSNIPSGAAGINIDSCIIDENNGDGSYVLATSISNTLVVQHKSHARAILRVDADGVQIYNCTMVVPSGVTAADYGLYDGTGGAWIEFVDTYIGGVTSKSNTAPAATSSHNAWSGAAAGSFTTVAYNNTNFGDVTSDWRIRTGSALVGGGDNTKAADMPNTAHDILGLSRSATYDVGSFEFASLGAGSSSYTLSGPSTGPTGALGAFITITLDAINIDVPITFTPVAAGCTFYPATPTLGYGAISTTFRCKASADGAHSISITDSSTLTDPGAHTYTTAAASASNKYIATAGSDAADGSVGTPWKTLNGAKTAMGGTWTRGATIHLNGGDSFRQAIVIDDTSTGSIAGDAVTFTSYGTGQAIIDLSARPDTNPFMLTNTGGVKIDNLDIKGSGILSNGQRGIVLNVTTTGGSALENITVSNNTIHDIRGGVWWYPRASSSITPISALAITDNVFHSFITCGVGLLNQDSTWNGRCSDAFTNGITGLTITGNTFRDSGGNGPDDTFGSAFTGAVTVGSMNDFNISNNVCYNMGIGSTTGGGFLVTVVCDNGIVSGNEVYDIHAGPSTGDNFGIDLDFATSNTTVEYNYIHDCAGPGIDLFEFPGGAHPAGERAWTNNVVRYNVLQNNGRAYWADFAFCGDGINNCDIYNNTIVHTAGGGNAIIGIVGGPGGVSTNIRFFNNIFLGSSSAVKIVDLSSGRNGSGWVWKNNSYFTNSGATINFNYGGAAYTTVAGWGLDSGAVSGNPGLPAPFTEVDGGIATLDKVTPALTANVVNAGLNLTAAPYSLTVGTRDFLGGSIPHSAYDIGAIELDLPASVSGYFYRMLIGGSHA